MICFLGFECPYFVNWRVDAVVETPLRLCILRTEL